MPSLSLYFPNEFPDPTLAGSTRRLVVPRPDGEGDEYLIGRSPELALTLPVKTISRRHAVISYSYAADRWFIQDLASTGGTWLNNRRLEPHNSEPLAIGDKVYLSSNPAISVVEDEFDTVSSNDDDGPATVVSLSPLNHLTGAEATPPTTPKTFADVAYLGANWLFSPTTPLGAVYRLIVLAVAVGLSIIVIGGHK